MKACRPFDERIDLWALDADSSNITHNQWIPSGSEEDADEDDNSSFSFGAWQSTGSSSWDAMSPSKGPSSSAPGIICRDTGAHHDLVWYERDSGRLMHTQYNRGGSGSWTDPHVVEGDFIGDPLLFSSQDDTQRFDFFGVQDDGEMYTLTWRSSDSGGTYSNLTSLGNTAIVSSPAVMSPSEDILEVVALGEDGRLKHQHSDEDGWLSNWEDLDVEALSAPTIASFDGRVWVMWLTAEEKLQASSLDVDEGLAQWRGRLQTSSLGGSLELSYLLPE